MRRQKMTITLLFLAGSARKQSFNKKLAKVAHDIAEKSGAEAKFIDLADFDMPLYNGDYEEANGLPEAAVKLKKLFAECDGFFIASPEYNSSFSSLLKNSLDWISRKHEKGEPPLVAYKNKVATITSTSPGGLGGLRGLVPLRMMLSNIAVTVIPEQLAVENAYEAFDEAGNITDEKQYQALKNLVHALIKTTQAMKNINK